MKIQIILGKVCITQRRGQWACRYIPMNMSNSRIHWAVKYRWTCAWKREVANVIMAANWPITARRNFPLKKLKVRISFSACYLMDKDGAYNAAKPIVDGLKAAGVIFDDSPKFIDLDVSQNRVEHIDQQGVAIIIEF